MTDEELDAIAARADAASSAPWVADTNPPDDVVVWGHGAPGDEPLVCNVGASPIGMVGVCFDADAPNAEFIAHARADVPALVAELRRARETLRECTRLICYSPIRRVDLLTMIDAALGTIGAGATSPP